MNGYQADNSGWAIVLAPHCEGWKVRCIHSGALLADGGGTCQSLEEALADVRTLSRLLAEDNLTVELFLTR